MNKQKPEKESPWAAQVAKSAPLIAELRGLTEVTKVMRRAASLQDLSRLAARAARRSGSTPP